MLQAKQTAASLWLFLNHWMESAQGCWLGAHNNIPTLQHFMAHRSRIISVTSKNPSVKSWLCTEFSQKLLNSWKCLKEIVQDSVNFVVHDVFSCKNTVLGGRGVVWIYNDILAFFFLSFQVSNLYYLSNFSESFCKKTLRLSCTKHLSCCTAIHDF